MRVFANSETAIYTQTITIRPECPRSGRPDAAPPPASRNRVANVTARRTNPRGAGASRETEPP
eukprot:6245871-Lingulodinium_polyedra.AAC.1